MPPVTERGLVVLRPEELLDLANQFVTRRQGSGLAVEPVDDLLHVGPGGEALLDALEIPARSSVERREIEVEAEALG